MSDQEESAQPISSFQEFNSHAEEDSVEEKVEKKMSKKPKRKIPLFLIIGIVVAILALAGGVFAYRDMTGMRDELEKQEEKTPSPQAQPTPPPPTSSGISPANPNTPPIIIDKLPTDTDGTSDTAVPDIPAKVTLPDPVLADAKVDGARVYTYSVELNETALKNYAGGLKYKIEAESCADSDVIKSVVEFSGTVAKPAAKNTIKIEIYSYAIKSSAPTAKAAYVISTKDGKFEVRGSTKVPTCYSEDEDNDNGTFSIPAPEIDTDLVDGKVHFDYDFDYDSTARKIIEKGMTHKIYAPQCKKSLGESEYEDLFMSTWDAGVMENVGLGVNIDEDDLPSDKSDMLVDASYEILDKDGDVIFTGFTKAPNCE